MFPPRKQYIRVFGVFDTDGAFSPEKIELEDGSRYEVDRVLSVRPRASACGGSPTLRYEVKIWGRVKYLFRETDTNRWFVEAKPT